MVVPAAETQIAVDFHLTNPTMVAITISVFVLGYGANQVFSYIVEFPNDLEYHSIRPFTTWSFVRDIWPDDSPATK